MQLKEREPFTIVGIPINTSVQNASKDCPKVWGEFIPRAEEIKNPKGKIMYSVCKETSGCDFRYTAGMESDEAAPEGMIIEKVPKEKWAVYEHKGKIDKLNETYAFIMEDMKKQGLKEKKFWLEVYDERYKHEQDDSMFEIWCAYE